MIVIVFCRTVVQCLFQQTVQYRHDHTSPNPNESNEKLNQIFPKICTKPAKIDQNKPKTATTKHRQELPKSITENDEKLPKID